MNLPRLFPGNIHVNPVTPSSGWMPNGSSSGHGDFLHERLNFDRCRFIRETDEIIDNASTFNVDGSFCNVQDRFVASANRASGCTEGRDRLGETIPYIVGPPPRVVASMQVQQLSSNCAQFPVRPPNVNPSRNCQSGTVDVEDLALYFETDRSQSNCPPRASYRATNSSQTHYRRARSRFEHSPTQSPKEIFQDSRENVGARCTGNWYGERFCSNCVQPFPLCTEERWLQCPASDRCPVYDTAYPYDGNVLPPCVYENFRDENGWYCGGYVEEDQLLEDYLSNEKRKEKSRDAARCRRSKETDIFTELAGALPVPPDQAAHLDKASVMRLAIAYLKVRAVVDSIPVPLAKSESTTEMNELFPKALNGFMLVLSSDGNMVYLSENVSDYLGISQMDMMGQSVYEYSHPCDHEELRECLSSKPQESNDKRQCSFFLRLKCTLTSKGRKVNLKSASYKVIHCTGRLTYIRESASNSTEDDDDEEREKEDEATEYDAGASLVLVGCPIPHPSNIEIPLGRHTFLSKHSLSMKFTYADEKLAEYLGWKSEELMGQSVFEFYHALDNLALDKSFKSLFSKGQCETVAYRFLGKRGGYAWVVTQATLIHCSKQQKPLSVVCVNYILSGVEREDEVYSARQLAARDTEATVKPEKLPSGSCLPIEPPELQLQVRLNRADLEEPSAPLVSAIERLATLHQESTGSFEGDEIERAKPLVVTASTFSPVERKEETSRVQDGSRKDNTFPRPVHVTEKSFIGVQALKESLEESLKENDEPKQKRQDRRQTASRAPFVFQGKPAVEYDSESTVRRDRPQAVTRHLFAPLSSINQEQPQQQQQEQQIPCRPAPQTATASIFAPRTEDMNKGFLTFSEDQPGLTMLKDEPEDLTHLAPTPGDVCVPLEDTPFLSDMLDEFILGNDNYCPLLSPGDTLTPELRSGDFGDPLKDPDLGDSTRNKSLGESLADSDPFMYGDSPSSPCSMDPSSVSPSLVKYRQSPDRSLDSLGSPTGGSGAEGLSEDEMLMLGISDNIGDDELALRAPYIPMSDQDEALELLISDDMVMWSPPQVTEKVTSKWMIDDREQRTSDSSLAQLLRTDQVVSRRYNDHGGGLVNPAQVLGQIPRKSTTLDVNRWSLKCDRTERPTKRIHATSLDPGNENKRIKCDETNDRNSPLGLEDHLLGRQIAKKSPSIGSSQLLRRLVSQQLTPRNSSYPSESLDVEGCKKLNDGRIRDLNGDDLDIEEADGDSGGGGSKGGGGKGARDSLENGETCQTSPRNPSSCSSVLMNLLVSGCDDTAMDSRNVPTLKSLTSPLSVSLDNQMVPRCPDSSDSMTYDHLSPDTRKHLSGSFISSEPIGSSSPMMPFEHFDYDPGIPSTGLLQVQTDLFGALLNRNLV